MKTKKSRKFDYMPKRKTGTREWASANYNIGIGCAHDCRYCYARASALRFKKIASPSDWTLERLQEKKQSTSKKEGWVMFPTTHDITPFYLEPAIASLTELLTNGNKVLIVTKPHLECVKAMCEALMPWKRQVLFRFTIGTYNKDTAKLWEPGAPAPSERMQALEYAYLQGYDTSVSMEPMLGSVEEAIKLFYMLQRWVTDKIWIGKMNKIDKRVAKESPEIAAQCEKILDNQNDDNILWLVRALMLQPKIEWKDSIKEVIERRVLMTT